MEQHHHLLYALYQKEYPSTEMHSYTFIINANKFSYLTFFFSGLDMWVHYRNPMAFRIYDYGDYVEVCVQYNNENYTRESLFTFIGEYIKCLNELLESKETIQM